MGGMVDFVADCGNCFGLCCVALPFSRSADFAFDKGGGEPCRNLADDFRCGVHDRLRPLGMPGCTTYDCFGAGQAVSQGTYGGRDWRSSRDHGAEMFEVFGSVRRLHEMAFHLRDARRHVPAGALADRLEAAAHDTESLAAGTAYDVLGTDVDQHRLLVAPLLREASDMIRGGLVAGTDVAVTTDRSDLAEARLAGRDLRAADLRGRLLLGADLRGADLRGADLLGADLRASRVDGADLTGALFLTQMQVNSATGDPATRLGFWLVRPGHWVAAGR